MSLSQLAAQNVYTSEAENTAHQIENITVQYNGILQHCYIIALGGKRDEKG